MKRTLIIFILSFTLTSQNFSQDKFSIGFSGGLVTPEVLIHEYDKLGSGYSIAVNYHFSDEVSTYLTVGKMIFGKLNNLIHNAAVTQFSLGIKYIFPGEKPLKPFVLFEATQHFGTIVYGHEERIGIEFGERIFKSSFKDEIFSLGIAAGVGLSNRINELISLDIYYITILYQGDTNSFYGRLFVGFNYSL